MSSRILTIVLLVGVALTAVVAIQSTAEWRLPGDQQGYEPVQPIAYSHRLHAGELQIDCLYCHFGATKSRYAGVPPTQICMNCHGLVTASWGAVREEDDRAIEEEREPVEVFSDEIQLIYSAMGLNDQREPDPTRSMDPIDWVKVHNLPDFVSFDHRPHVGIGVRCQTCHGPVETMERVRQAESLSMGWCVNCHRETAQTGVAGRLANPSIDCVTCHY